MNGPNYTLKNKSIVDNVSWKFELLELQKCKSTMNVYLSSHEGWLMDNNLSLGFKEKGTQKIRVPYMIEYFPCR